jgi:anti-sigma regulatory factor (Ser/Thr protein kinase)
VWTAPPPGNAPLGNSGNEVEAPLDITLPVTTTAPALARRTVERWLRAQAWPPEELADLVFAVSEAVSNSVEHGHGLCGDAEPAPGEITVHGIVQDAPDGRRSVQLTIRDQGTWRPPPDDPDGRRRGLLLMRAVSEELRLEVTDCGTTVVLRSTPIAPTREPGGG